MEKVSENVFLIKFKQNEPNLLDVNSYLLLDKRILIDVGPESLDNFNKLKHSLQKVNLKISDLNMIILTHHHIDHIGLIKYIDCDVPILGPKYLEFYSTNKYLSMIENIPNSFSLPKDFICDIKSRLRDEYITNINCNYVYPSEHIYKYLKDNYGLCLKVMKGHCSEDLIISDSHGNVFSGDILIHKIFFNCIFEVPYFNFYRNDYYDELKYLSKNAKKLFPGHGSNMDKNDLNHSINVTCKRMSRTEKKVEKLKDKNINNIYSLCNEIFSNFLPYSKFLPFSEIYSIISMHYNEQLWR